MSQQHKSMKGVFWEGKPYHMTVKETPRPTLQDSRDVIVKVTYAAICGSDLHTYHGILGSPDVPYLMGHEAIGVIHEVGKKVQKYQVNDHVVVPDVQIVDSTIYIYGEGSSLGPSPGGCQCESLDQGNLDILADMSSRICTRSVC